MNKSNLDGPMVLLNRFWMTFGSPFWLNSSTFFKKRKTLILMTLTWFRHVFLSHNLSFFGSFFIDFSCIYRNPPKRAFLEGSGADLASTGRFWCHFRFSEFPKRRLLAHHFRLICRKKLPGGRAGTVLDAIGDQQ
jgi:hypothetical protein